MKWLIKAPLELLATVVAYITNPIVVLFTDEYGWLPNWLIWWQTFDNTLDVEWMIKEDNVPAFAKYDYDKHYIYHYEKMHKDGSIDVGHVDIIDGEFTLKERFQRYICRLCWLYRNTNYGFSYYVNGEEINPDKLVIIKDEEDKTTKYECFIGYEPRGIWNTVWCIYYSCQYCKWFRIRLYLGWKIKSKKAGVQMLALFVSPFRSVKK